ncbi:MAG: hypothetical protein AABP62_07640 [Planctomycetota bacterium]
MARIETVLSVFVASPGDVVDARKRLERVVDELNFVWSREYRLRLELVKWETHAYSDIGVDAQDVINKQLNQFDIFLGIMWKRLGEPTGRAESGTEEEFLKACHRHEQDPKLVRVMFYFKDAAPGRLSEVDTRQLEAVNRFQKEVANAGVYYRTFKTVTDFEKLVRQHLSRQVQEWGKSWGGVVGGDKPTQWPEDDTGRIEQEPDPATRGAARSITAIVFEQLEFVDKLRQRPQHDPEVIHRSFLEAQVILDSSPEEDDWGRIAAQQAAALVTVALASRLEPSDPAKTYVAQVCDRVLSLRGLRIEWETEDPTSLFELASAARDRHDDDVLGWIKARAVS